MSDLSPSNQPAHAPTDAQVLVLRGIQAIETLRAETAAFGKTVDSNSRDLDTVKASIIRVEGLLSRIAAAEERRTVLAEKAEERHDAWVDRLWASKPVQLVFLALALALANLLGHRWDMAAGTATKTTSVLPGGP